MGKDIPPLWGALLWDHSAVDTGWTRRESFELQGLVDWNVELRTKDKRMAFTGAQRVLPGQGWAHLSQL